jgi:hypothetical protein
MKTLAAVLGLMGLVTAGAAQAGPASPPNGVLGVLSSNGTFRPVLGAGHDGVPPPPPKTFVGTLKLTLNITVDSSLPTGTGILCGLNAGVTGVSETGNIDVIEDVGQKLAGGSGSTATCTVEVPYSWRLTAYDGSDAVSPDQVSLSYTITAIGTGQQGRTTLESFDTIAVPKNGKTTAYTLSARI